MNELDRLAARSQLGDAAALEEVLAILERKVYRLAVGLTGNHADAEDLTQETLLRVYARLELYDPARGSFETWAYHIARNLWIKWAARRKNTWACSLDVLASPGQDAEVPVEIADEGDGPEEEFEKKEFKEVVRRLIGELPPKSRAAVVLREIEGYAYREIAAALGCSEAAAKLRINRARRILKQKLARAGYSPVVASRRARKGRGET